MTSPYLEIVNYLLVFLYLAVFSTLFLGKHPKAQNICGIIGLLTGVAIFVTMAIAVLQR